MFEEDMRIFIRATRNAFYWRQIQRYTKGIRYVAHFPNGIKIILTRNHVYVDIILINACSFVVALTLLDLLQSSNAHWPWQYLGAHPARAKRSNFLMNTPWSHD